MNTLPFLALLGSFVFVMVAVTIHAIDKMAKGNNVR